MQDQVGLTDRQIAARLVYRLPTAAARRGARRRAGICLRDKNSGHSFRTTVTRIIVFGVRVARGTRLAQKDSVNIEHRSLIKQLRIIFPRLLSERTVYTQLVTVSYTLNIFYVLILGLFEIFIKLSKSITLRVF